MKNIDRAIIFLLCGFTIGALLALSTKYPLEIHKIDQYKSYCPDSSITSITVGLDGNIHKVKCANGKEADIPQDP